MAKVLYFFDEYGTVGDIFEPFDRTTGKRKTFVFVRFTKEKHMLRALNEAQGSKIGGKFIRCQISKEKQSKEKYKPETLAYPYRREIPMHQNHVSVL